MPFTASIAVPTLIGSVLSCIATFTVIVLRCLGPSKRHPRHALVLNLLVAGMTQSTNYDRTISKILTIARMYELDEQYNIRDRHIDQQTQAQTPFTWPTMQSECLDRSGICPDD